MHLIPALYVIAIAPTCGELLPMQSDWRLTWTHDGKPAEKYANGVLGTIRWDRITTKDPDECMQELFSEKPEFEHTLNKLYVVPGTKPKKIYIMWCEGIYDITPNRLRFCVKYHGQGVEGEAARCWKAPVDFVVRDGQEHDYWTFERVRK